ncbi:p-loop containing nucleoside triphosphate hydrolase protein [Diplodia corticola]|uniref:p-loop containing nucleoside triphosphate hydrolase protein n=1 Tax=Diplodia corticola TaxID=236234 RepID=A0A1J9RXN9_9PEZI|nr:p-loop containing nucleoside triphosphate hydrolase protein [Diplodia corticola]OJD32237.1 p-loop containing nucleoside triphosphate hydrolase protein [Diplodia corticola]
MPSHDANRTATNDGAPSPSTMDEFIPLLYKLLLKTTENISSQDTPKSSNSEGDADDAEPAEGPGSRLSIKALVERPDKENGELEIIEKDKYSKSQNDSKFASHALVTKQTFDAKRNLEKTTVEINSPHIRAALSQVVSYYPSESLKFGQEDSVVCKSPYAMLHHHKTELHQYAAKAVESGNAEADTITAHINLLLAFLESEMGDDGPALRNMVDAGLITFDLLWAIFKPGDVLFASEHGHPRLYRCKKAAYGHALQGGKYFDVTCEFTNGDGLRAGTSTVSIRIWHGEVFVGTGTTAIDNLPLFPLSFLRHQDDLEERLIERGNRYLDIRGVTTWDYEGLFLYLKNPPYDYYNECASFNGIWLPHTASHRVVVDPKTFVEEATKHAQGFDCDDDEDDDDDDDDDDCRRRDMASQKPSAFSNATADPLFCPPFVFGFSLETKQWCKLFIDSLSPVQWIPNAMDSLIIPPAQRHLIQALVTAHRFPENARNEASLKGKGLIALLHGTPGSGKTLTAELVAEQTRRPLLKISTGELGSYGTRIAMEMQGLLTYASIWRAIVLIDEADVFLEARSSGPDQFEHNNLVAIFLKQLEYFQGILFLTSNRVSIFDPAIRSRLHLALQYHAPDAERRKQIWRQQLGRVEAEDKDLDLDSVVERTHRVEMNGREISNAVNTALTLAKSEHGKLGLEHLEIVLKVWDDFESTLRNIEDSS